MLSKTDSVRGQRWGPGLAWPGVAGKVASQCPREGWVHVRGSLLPSALPSPILPSWTAGPTPHHCHLRAASAQSKIPQALWGTLSGA